MMRINKFDAIDKLFMIRGFFEDHLISLNDKDVKDASNHSDKLSEIHSEVIAGWIEALTVAGLLLEEM